MHTLNFEGASRHHAATVPLTLRRRDCDGRAHPPNTLVHLSVELQDTDSGTFQLHAC